MFGRSYLAILFSFILSPVYAADHAAALKNYLTDDVAAVAYVDLAKIDLQATLGWFEDLDVVPESAWAGVQKIVPMVQHRIDQFEKYGVTHVYVLLRVSDISHQGVTWVVPVAKGGDPQAVKGLILSGRPDEFHVEHDARPPFFPLVCETVDDCVLGAMNEEQLEMLRTKRPKTERDLTDAWEALGNGDVGLIIFGDADSRRVLREMFPNLPAPFSEIDGKLIAEGLKWGGLKVDLPPEPGFELLIDTSAEEVAKTLDNAVQELWALVKDLPQEKILLEQKLRDLLTDKLQPRVEGKRVRISLRDVTVFASLLRPPIETARESARRVSRLNNFRQIGLAMHNYADKNKVFPARNSVSEDGKPLLSWRVHILPYLEQQELYEKFRLDEPWDSEHNRHLQTQMPAVYADPESSLTRINSMGKTTYVMPASTGTVGRSEEPISFKDITDGLSNTIMLVEVNPDNAVIWTRPDDWQVNLNRPLQGLEREDRQWFTAGYCDGSVQVISIDIAEKTLRAMLTYAGEEVIER